MLLYFSVILYCTVLLLYCTVRYYCITALYCDVLLYCTVLYCCGVLLYYCTVLYCSVLYYCTVFVQQNTRQGALLLEAVPIQQALQGKAIQALFCMYMVYIILCPWGTCTLTQRKARHLHIRKGMIRGAYYFREPDSGGSLLVYCNHKYFVFHYEYECGTFF